MLGKWLLEVLGRACKMPEALSAEELNAWTAWKHYEETGCPVKLLWVNFALHAHQNKAPPRDPNRVLSVKLNGQTHLQVCCD